MCSVDPPGCKDIDDALHVRALPGGTLELGVHIADVTTFLKPETAMDDEAAIRCSAYIPPLPVPPPAFATCEAAFSADATRPL